MMLSDNFSLDEFTKSQTAIRRGIKNQPTNTQRAFMIDLCVNILEPIREHFGKPISISSGFRSSALNAAIGGSNTSQHSLGQAADFEIKGVSNDRVAKWIKDNLQFDQLILEGFDDVNPNAGWIHVSYGPRQRKMYGTWNLKRGYSWGSLT